MALTVEEKQTRAAFRKRYGRTTEDVVKRTLRGQNTQQIADALQMSKRSVATTVGNFTRGIYSQYTASY